MSADNFAWGVSVCVQCCLMTGECAHYCLATAYGILWRACMALSCECVQYCLASPCGIVWKVHVAPYGERSGECMRRCLVSTYGVV